MQPREQRCTEMWDERFDALAAIWKKRLGLNDWSITYALANVIDGDADIRGCCEVHRELGKRASITFADHLADEGEATREETIVHELLHVVFDEMVEFAEMCLPSEHRAYFRRLLEITVSDVGAIVMGIVHAEEGGNNAD